MFPTLSTLSRNSVAAGMPNITGSFYAATRINDTTGAFTRSSRPEGFNGLNNHSGTYNTFDASRSSSIYGKSKTVTPLSRKCLFLVKY